MIELRYYLAADGKSPFEDWFLDLNAPAAAKVTVALARLEQGNFSNVKGVGEGVLEYKIDHGPGYRVYFGRDGELLVILLTRDKAAAGQGRRRGQGLLVRLQAATTTCEMRERPPWR